MATTPGMTAAGLVTERFPEARDRVAAIWRSKFGQNSPTAPGTENGLIIDAVALCVALLWESLGAVYGGSFFRTAVDRALDLWTDAFGFRRFQPSPSSTVLTLYGTAEASVSALVQAQTEVGTKWATQAAVELGDGVSGLVWVVTVDAVNDGVTYEIAITGDAGSPYQFVGDNGLSLAEHAEALVAELGPSTDATIVYPGDDPDGLPVLLLRSADGETALEVAVSGPLTLYPAADAEAECTVDGPTVAAAGTINAMVTAVGGVDGVINETDAVLGSTTETNAAHKRRFIRGQGVYEKGTARAIESALLRLAQTYDLPYAEAYARENVFAVEVDGVPPHAMAPLVFLPGVPAAEIAAAILATKNSGYQSFGAIETVLLDSKGSAVTIGHTEATELYLHVRVTVSVVGEAWPDEGDPLTAIELALADDANGEGWLLEPGRLRIGVDLYRLDLVGPVIDAVGVGAIKSMTIELATTAAPEDPPTFADADLVVDPEAVLIPAGSRVTAVQS